MERWRWECTASTIRGMRIRSKLGRRVSSIYGSTKTARGKSRGSLVTTTTPRPSNNRQKCVCSMTLRTSGAGRGESEVENKKAGARGSTEEYEQSTWCPDCKTGIAGRERKTLPSEQDSAGGDDGMLEPRLKRHVEL